MSYQKSPNSNKEKTILLIEDEESVRRTYAHALKLKGYKVIDIADVSDNKLESALEGGRIDVIISGVMQPYKDGFQVLKELKADERYKNIPYIISSNLWRDSIIKQAMDLGAALYLVKVQETPASWAVKVDEFLRNKK